MIQYQVPERRITDQEQEGLGLLAQTKQKFDPIVRHHHHSTVLRLARLSVNLFPDDICRNISALFPRRRVRLSGCSQDTTRLPWVPEDRREHVSIGMWFCRRFVLSHEYAQRW